MRLVLDNGIEWEIISVSNTRIKARLNTAYLTDLYLTGPHKLVLETPQTTLQHQIRVGTPELVFFLQPQILSVTVIRDEAQVPIYLEVQGHNLMLNPHFAQAKVNGEIVAILASSLLNGTQTLQVALPEDSAPFSQPGQHSLTYQTPMGMHVMYFES
ncbi:MAG: hypothetical protein IGS03_00950 [Candidatus Sericytochromatia bacterium]|nr:hypothetical protein [Candidatus Sericytochromatia bacterium]